MGTDIASLMVSMDSEVEPHQLWRGRHMLSHTHVHVQHQTQGDTTDTVQTALDTADTVMLVTSELRVGVAQHTGKVGRPVLLRIYSSNLSIVVCVAVDDGAQGRQLGYQIHGVIKRVLRDIQHTHWQYTGDSTCTCIYTQGSNFL